VLAAFVGPEAVEVATLEVAVREGGGKGRERGKDEFFFLD